MFLVMYVQDSEEENLQDTEMDEGDEANAAVVEDGESTDAESDNSNDDLNVHQFLAELEAEFDKLQAQADLDHTDSVDFALPEEGVETLPDEDFEETLGRLAIDGGASDEDMEEREPSDAEAVLPSPPPVVDMTRRRLRGKQRPPAAYQNAPAPAPAPKRHGLLKRPSRKTKPPRPCQTCEGYQGRSCRFDPRRPGQAARVQPSRGIKTCIFCSPERMQEAHRGSRPAALKDLLSKTIPELA